MITMKWIEVDGDFYNLETACLVSQDKDVVWVYFPASTAYDSPITEEERDRRYAVGDDPVDVRWTPIVLQFEGEDAALVLRWASANAKRLEGQRVVPLGAKY